MTATRRFFLNKRYTGMQALIWYLSGCILIAYGFGWFLVFSVSATMIDIIINIHLDSKDHQ